MKTKPVRGGVRKGRVGSTAFDPKGIDLAKVRRERLGRLQAAMRAHGAEACLFFNQGNVRYATGSAIMTVYSMSAFVRAADAGVGVDGRSFGGGRALGERHP